MKHGTADAASVPNRRRVAITGLGVISGLGIGLTDFWDGLSTGRSGFSPITVFPCEDQRVQMAAEVPNFRPQDFFSRRELRRSSRCDQLGGLAAQEALAMSGLLEDRFQTLRASIGISLGAGAGGSRSGELFYRQLRARNPFDRFPTRAPLLLSYAPSATTDFLGQKFNLFGPRSTVVTACSSSNTAFAVASDWIRSGECPIVLCGGSEALSELTFTGFNALRAVSQTPCRPFDRFRDGLSLGEGAGILVFEDWEHAEHRGAKILGEFLGYGLASDTHHMTAPEPTGDAAFRAMQRALQNSGLRTEQISYVSAHGTATPQNDVAEARAIARLFPGPVDGGKARIPASSVKSMTGHCLGASAAIEGVAAVVSLLHQRIPPTIHHVETDPECPVDCVPNSSRIASIDTVLSNSFAFGGNNTTVVFGRADRKIEAPKISQR